MKKKRPAFYFFTSDWLTDVSVRSLSPAARGCWIDILCWMWEHDQNGELTLPVDNLASLLGISVDDLDAILTEYIVTNVCDVRYETPKNTPEHPVDNPQESVDNPVEKVCTENRKIKNSRVSRNCPTQCHANVTLTNRRMMRDEKARKKNRLRKQKQRYN